ncbi:MAG: hypothetical protein ACYC0C_13400 [Devosia sp.]
MRRRAAAFWLTDIDPIGGAEQSAGAAGFAGRKSRSSPAWEELGNPDQKPIQH